MARPRKPFVSLESWDTLVQLGAKTSKVFKYRYGPIAVFEQDVELDKNVLSERWSELVLGMIEVFARAEPDFIWLTDEVGTPVPPHSSDFDARFPIAAMWSHTIRKPWVAESFNANHFRSWIELTGVA